MLNMFLLENIKLSHVYVLIRWVWGSTIFLRIDLVDFKISKDGVFRLDASAGDDDGSSRASITLHKDHWKAFDGVPFVLTNSGGDHASGWWGFKGSATITISQ